MITSAPPPETVRVQTRVQSIDILRGAVMMVMALDHLRDFIHSAAQSFSPTDLGRTTAAIFFTRWITHFCAPVFMLTAGLGVFLWARRRTTSERSRFLWTRGLWLIVLDLSAVHLALYFNFDYSLVILNVLWALGWSMIALAGLAYLPYGALVVVSAGVIGLHNLADGVTAAQFGRLAPIWNFLHQLGVFPFGGRMVLIAYPLIPWVGVMAAGYCCGGLFLLEPHRRRRLLVRLGLGLTGAFFVLRILNLYGDPAPWSRQSSAVFTVLSFLNCTKYPPSLEFLLMTLGPALLAVGLMERVRLSSANPLLVFGRTPLFYFVVHLFLIHLAAMLLANVRYGHGSFFFNPPPSMGGPRQDFPADYGFGLGVVYAVWVALLVLLYPPCRWFAQIKQRRKDWWLSYL